MRSLLDRLKRRLCKLRQPEDSAPGRHAAPVNCDELAPVVRPRTGGHPPPIRQPARPRPRAAVRRSSGWPWHAGATQPDAHDSWWGSKTETGRFWLAPLPDQEQHPLFGQQPAEQRSPVDVGRTAPEHPWLDSRAALDPSDPSHAEPRGPEPG